LPEKDDPLVGTDAVVTDAVVGPFDLPSQMLQPERRRPQLARARVLLPAAAILVVLVMAAFPAAFAGWFGHGDPRACNLTDSGQPPRAGHPFGFDIQGCDLYSNVVYGARASVSIALLVTSGCVVISLVLGCLAAYYRGWVDSVVSRTIDVFFGFPALVGQVVILNAIHRRSVPVVSAVLILFVWPSFTRLMRASALATVELDYVKAAAGVGAGPWRLLTRHVLPNSYTPLMVVSTLAIGGIITAESALTFLGVGLQAPSISWGVQLNSAQDLFRTHLHLLVFPSLFLTCTVLAFVLLGDALRDTFDPRMP
jgi:oligopeptide transport system permease protein